METATHPLLKISHQLGQGKRQWLLAPPLRAWVVLTLLPSPTRTSLSLPCNLAGYGRLAALQSQEDIVQRKGCRLALGKNFQPACEKRGRVEGFHHLQAWEAPSCLESRATQLWAGPQQPRSLWKPASEQGMEPTNVNGL